MDSASNEPMVVIADNRLRDEDRVWGSGIWVSAEEREAVDWLTFSRLTGWAVSVLRLGYSDFSPGVRWITLAQPPDSLTETEVSQLASVIAAEPVLLVTSAANQEHPLAHLGGAARRPEQIVGRDVRWVGPGPDRAWRWVKDLDVPGLEFSDDASVWATLGGAPLIVARRVGSSCQ